MLDRAAAQNHTKLVLVTAVTQVATTPAAARHSTQPSIESADSVPPRGLAIRFTIEVRQRAIYRECDRDKAVT